MAKKTEKSKLIEIAAKVLSIEPKMLEQALDNALEISVLKRDNMLLAQMLNKERQDHEKEIASIRQQGRN